MINFTTLNMEAEGLDEGSLILLHYDSEDIPRLCQLDEYYIAIDINGNFTFTWEPDLDDALYERLE